MSRNNPIHYSEEELALKRAFISEADRLLKIRFGDPSIKKQSGPLDTLIITILSQSTSDHNRDLAFSELKRRFPTWKQAAEASESEIADAIRSGGLANQKSRRIKDILSWVWKKSGEYSLDWLEDYTLNEAIEILTALKGVGIKTAAVVMCFAFDAEIFPVDVHIHRICRRLGLAPIKTAAEKTHRLMQPLISPGRCKAFHLNLLILGRRICRPSNPSCEECPLSGICPYFSYTSS